MSRSPPTELGAWRIKPGCIQSNTRSRASMLPQSAVGCWVPRPRKDSPAAARIFAPTSRLKATTTGEMSCGTTGRTRRV